MFDVKRLLFYFIFVIWFLFLIFNFCYLIFALINLIFDVVYIQYFYISCQYLYLGNWYCYQLSNTTRSNVFLCHLWSGLVVAILMTPELVIILRILREYALYLATQIFFRFAATHWWNATPIDLYPTIKNLHYQGF